MSGQYQAGSFKLFSVIIIHYNQPDFWKTAVASVLSQMYPMIELVFADDCSDKVQKKDVEDYIRENRKKNLLSFSVIFNKSNLGTVKNINNAILTCNGEYVLFFAADDALCDEHVLEHFAEALDGVPEDVCGVFAKSLDCDMELVPRKTDPVSLGIEMEFGQLSAWEQYRRLTQKCQFCIGATAFKSKKLQNYLPLDENYYLIEDWPFALRVTRSGERFCFSDFNALFYRDGGISRPIGHRSEVATARIIHDHLLLYDQEILPYTKRLTIKELRDITERYDKDRCELKKQTKDLKSLKRIEVLKRDWRFVFILWNRQDQFFKKVVRAIVASIGLLIVIMHLPIITPIYYGIISVESLWIWLFCLTPVRGSIVQTYRKIKRYLFSPDE